MAALDAAIHASRSLTQCTDIDLIAYFLDAATTYVSNAWMAGTRPAMTGGGLDFSKTIANAIRARFCLDKIRNISYQFSISESVSRSAQPDEERLSLFDKLAQPQPTRE